MSVYIQLQQTAEVYRFGKYTIINENDVEQAGATGIRYFLSHFIRIVFKSSASTKVDSNDDKNQGKL